MFSRVYERRPLRARHAAALIPLILLVFWRFEITVRERKELGERVRARALPRVSYRLHAESQKVCGRRCRVSKMPEGVALFLLMRV